MEQLQMRKETDIRMTESKKIKQEIYDMIEKMTQLDEPDEAIKNSLLMFIAVELAEIVDAMRGAKTEDENSNSDKSYKNNMNNRKQYGCKFAVCVTSGDGFEQGKIYPILGNNNGVHIVREKYAGRVNDPGGDSSDPYDFLACTGGYGHGLFNNWDSSGKPSFDPYPYMDGAEND